MEDKQNTDNGNQMNYSNILMGLIFIVGGSIVLLNQFNLLPFELNWWAVFIMLPAAGFLSGAYNRFRATNSMFSMDVLFPGFMGLFMIGLSVSLLVGASWNFNWNLLWPIVLILLGLSMILGRSQNE